jgi:hypothetical protein
VIYEKFNEFGLYEILEEYLKDFDKGVLSSKVNKPKQKSQQKPKYKVSGAWSGISYKGGDHSTCALAHIGHPVDEFGSSAKLLEKPHRERDPASFEIPILQLRDRQPDELERFELAEPVWRSAQTAPGLKRWRS